MKEWNLDMAGNRIKVSRGFLVICDECHSYLIKEELLNNNNSKSDEIIHDLCPNCTDYNKPLIDDLLGSSE